MKTTVSALFESQADAERAREALRAHGFGEDVEIHDETGDKERRHGLFGRHRDVHVHDEALRRGHVLLTARVDDARETLAAEVIEAAHPMDVGERESAWRGEGWTAPAEHREAEVQMAAQSAEAARSFSPELRVRSYISSNAIDSSSLPGR